MSVTLETREQKLEELIHVLANDVPAGSWDMEIWYHTQDTKKVECGYAGCALGHAAVHPKFMELGLSIQFSHGRSNPGVVKYRESVNKEYISMNAGSEFFGLTGTEARFLFDVDNYYTATVDSDIEDVLTERGELDRYLMRVEEDEHGRYDDENMPKITIEMVIDHITFLIKYQGEMD